MLQDPGLQRQPFVYANFGAESFCGSGKWLKGTFPCWRQWICFGVGEDQFDNFTLDPGKLQSDLRRLGTVTSPYGSSGA